MTALYNELDPFAAQWLISTRGRSAGSPCGQSARDTSDTAPKPSRATCSSSTSARRLGAATRDDGPHQAHESRHTTHTRVGHPGCSGKNGSDSRRAAASLLCERDTRPLVAVVSGETCGPTLHCSHADNDRSTATYCPDRVQSETSFRKRGTHVRALAPSQRCAFATWICMSRSNSADGCASPAGPSRIQYSAAGATSCLH